MESWPVPKPAVLLSQLFFALERYLPDQRVGHPPHDAGLCPPAAQRRRGARLVAVHFFAALARHHFLRAGRAHLFAQRPAGPQEGASKKIRLVQEQFLARGDSLPSLPPNVSPLAALAARLGDFEPLQGNRVELLTDYQGSIQRLIADIEAARRHVHLLCYIYEDDETGRRVAEALAGAAARGVKCRVLLDAVGSKRALRGLAPKMRRDGVEVTALLPAGLFRRNAARFDLRNHRKIAVIDGGIGYSGSQNICDGQFVKGFPNQELVARLAGPVVWQLQAVFLADYYQETTTVLDGMEIFPEPAQTGESIAQALPSGPGYGRENAQELLIALLYEARERAVLTTPYFVPDEPFLEGMRAAARRGVAVHLVVSEHANQRLTQLAQRSFYDESAGGRGEDSSLQAAFSPRQKSYD